MTPCGKRTADAPRRVSEGEKGRISANAARPCEPHSPNANENTRAHRDAAHRPEGWRRCWPALRGVVVVVEGVAFTASSRWMVEGSHEPLTVTRAALCSARTQKERPHSGAASPRIAAVLPASGRYQHRRLQPPPQPPQAPPQAPQPPHSLRSALPSSTSARRSTERS